MGTRGSVAESVRHVSFKPQNRRQSSPAADKANLGRARLLRTCLLLLGLLLVLAGCDDTLELTANPNPAVYGRSVSFNATFTVYIEADSINDTITVESVEFAYEIPEIGSVVHTSGPNPAAHATPIIDWTTWQVVGYQFIVTETDGVPAHEFSEPGEYTATVNASISYTIHKADSQEVSGSRSDSATVNFQVVAADVDVDSDNNGSIDDNDDPIELSAPGCIIPMGERRPLKVGTIPTNPAQGTLTLFFPANSTVTVWDSETGGTQVTGTPSWTFGTQSQASAMGGWHRQDTLLKPAGLLV